MDVAVCPLGQSIYLTREGVHKIYEIPAKQYNVRARAVLQVVRGWLMSWCQSALQNHGGKKSEELNYSKNNCIFSFSEAFGWNSSL